MIKSKNTSKAKRFAKIITVFVLIFSMTLPVLTSCSKVKTTKVDGETLTDSNSTTTKLDYDMSGVKFEDTTFVYDGKPHSIYISGTLPEGVSFKYLNNEKTEEGVYYVTARFTGRATHNPIDDMIAKMTIKKQETSTVTKLDYDMSGITFNGAEYEYDGSAKSLKINGTLPAGVSVKYEGNARVESGEWEVRAIFEGDAINYNPIPSMSAILKINPKTDSGLKNVDMSGISFNSKVVNYDGNAHTITLTGDLPEGIASVRYENNSGTEVGVYNATAYFTVESGYNPVSAMQATLTINSTTSTIALSEMSFADAEYEYDGNAKSLTAVYPSSKATVEYSNNGKTEKGVYEVTATFTAKEGYVFAGGLSTYTLKATLTIKEVDTPDSSMIFVVNSSWSSAKLYVWNETSGNATAMASWPGTAMQSMGNGYFYYDTSNFDTEYENIIFNNGSSGSGNQTADLTYPNLEVNNCYDCSSSAWCYFDGEIIVVPTISATKGSGKFTTDTIEVTFTVKDATSATYSLDDGAEQTLSGSVTLTLGAGLTDGQQTKVTINANYKKGTVTQTYTYTRKVKQDLNGDILLHADEDAMKEYNLADSIRDGEMLQCFVWSFDEIAEHAEAIAEAGYTAIQTSPVQVCKEQTIDDGTGNPRRAKDVWMMYYQPAAFTVEDGDDNALGNVESFVNMINVLHSYGIKVMVDVVSNHLGNQWWAKYVCERSYYYEPEICGITDSNGVADYSKIPDMGTYWNEGNMYDTYANNYTYTKNRIGYKATALTANLLGFTTEKDYIESWMAKFLDMQEGANKDTHHFHDYIQSTGGDDTEQVLWGEIGMPDLDTSDPVVQEAVADYLVELVNYGVDGFRFDAAKHIETPSDGKYASNYWPVVLGAANDAADSIGKELYYYGETINTLGEGRELQYYTDMVGLDGKPLNFDITDFNPNKSYSGFTYQFSSFKYQGSADQVKGHLVGYPEGHDTYVTSGGVNPKTSGYSKAELNQNYISMCATQDVVPCHMARWRDYDTVNLGGVVTNLDGTPYIDYDGVYAPCVSGMNQFRNLYNSADAGIKYINNNTVERYIVNGKSNQNGICLMNQAGTVSISVSYMADGTYVDLVSGNIFTVSGGVLRGTVDSSGVAAITAIANIR